MQERGFDPFSVPVSHPYVLDAFALSAPLVCRIVLHLTLEYILKDEHEPRLPQSAGTLRAYRYLWAPRAQRFGVSPSLARIGFAGYPRPLPTPFCCSRGVLSPVLLPQPYRIAELRIPPAHRRLNGEKASSSPPVPCPSLVTALHSVPGWWRITAVIVS
ncbi:hypothetical protein K438DRAFT_1789183 [Mycena galopus ATCC 62051]|nr:hypothetical protein K438DRAFT_1789183 [Mycena galopus ATCC 62051]